jgi:hypothetical protein
MQSENLSSSLNYLNPLNFLSVLIPFVLISPFLSKV